MTTSVRKFGNDLFADLTCTCPHKDYVDGPLANIIKTKITLSGYNDNYFFEVVNKEPRIISCECGKKYSVQWQKNEGIMRVSVNEINEG